MLTINKIIRTLIISDVFIYSSWGLIMPVFAVFVVDSINGGDVGVVGAAVGIYWVVKSILQIPIGKYLDKNHGEKDDYWFMIVGILLASFTPLLFLVSSEPWHIYGLQVLHAIGMAMAIPSWGGLFTRHMDRGREAETWSLESSSLGFGIGVTSIVGGLVAKTFGFDFLFIGIFVLGISGVLLLLLIKNDIVPKADPARHAEHLSQITPARDAKRIKEGEHIK